MGFVIGFLKVRGGSNVLWVIVDQLNKSTHFIVVKDTTSTN